MVEFVTLLLGLVVGTQAVEVSVSDEVAHVEIRLDGDLVEILDGVPWFANCDFGAELRPHELSAVAFDTDGRELSRARQWVNLPRQRIEARLSLERTGERTEARLIWSSLDHSEEPQVALTFDGTPLAFDDPERIVLSPHDLEDFHFLRAELRFSAHESAFAEVAFGGSSGEEVSAVLTALPVLVDKRLPKVRDMDGWFTRRGRPLRAVAVERGPVNLLVVRERSDTVQNGLRFLYQRFQAQRIQTRLPPVVPKVLSEDDRVRFAFPTLGRQSVTVGSGLVRLDTEQVPVSLPLGLERRQPRRPGQTRPGRTPVSSGATPGFRSLFDMLTNAFYTTQEAPAGTHQLSDAVAIAGLTAATGDFRRLVILITSGDSTDNSRFEAADVRGYLDALRVPLVVWSVPAEGAGPSAWDGSVDISQLKDFQHALDKLRKTLQSQALVWLEGAHLVDEIEITAEARGLRPVDEPRAHGGRVAPPTPAGAATPAPEVAPREASGAKTWRTVQVGPYTLRSEVRDRGLLELLERVASSLPRVFAERYGIPVDVESPLEILLFAREDEYLAFKSARGHAGAEPRATGYFEAPAMIVLHRGTHLRQEMAASLAHELTHALSWRLLGRGSDTRRPLPPWLAEGLADDLSMSSPHRRHGLLPSPLSPANLRYGRSLGAVLVEALRDLDQGSAPSLSTLAAMDRPTFLAGDSELHYLFSALWVRFLLDGEGGELAAGFQAFLQAVAAGDGTGYPDLLGHLDRGEAELARGFRSWLGQQQRRLLSAGP